MRHRPHAFTSAATAVLYDTARGASPDITSAAHPGLATGAALALAVLAAIAAASLPDRDLRVIRRFPRAGALLPHRGPTHSLPGTAVIGMPVAVGAAALGFPRAGVCFMLGLLSHLFLDLLSTGAGLSLLAPYGKRYKILRRQYALRHQHGPTVSFLCGLAIVVCIVFRMFGTLDATLSTVSLVIAGHEPINATLSLLVSGARYGDVVRIARVFRTTWRIPPRDRDTATKRQSFA